MHVAAVVAALVLLQSAWVSVWVACLTSGDGAYLCLLLLLVGRIPAVCTVSLTLLIPSLAQSPRGCQMVSQLCALIGCTVQYQANCWVVLTRSICRVQPIHMACHLPACPRVQLSSVCCAKGFIHVPQRRVGPLSQSIGIHCPQPPLPHQGAVGLFGSPSERVAGVAKRAVGCLRVLLACL
jgi:hypothetical protein